MMNSWMRKLGVLAGIAAISCAAQAYFQDATILIDRALNSSTMTVRYSGARVAMIEIRINGVSVGTRNVDARLNSGETNFVIDPKSLRDGDNDLEVRAFDGNGKIVGIQNTKIAAERQADSPAKLLGVKSGATVQGPLEISLGFTKDLRNSYVSFFIDDEFKSLKNFPPYSYVWDTTRSPNGWHDLEAWVVDEANNTYKTAKTKVFVNNPGGRTERPLNTNAGTPAKPVEGSVDTKPTEPAKPALQPSTNPSTPVNAQVGVKPSPNQQATAVLTAADPVAPSAAAIVATGGVQAAATGASGLKPSEVGMGTTTGPKLLVPKTGNTTAPIVTNPSKPVIVVQQSGAPKAPPIAVTNGVSTNLPMLKIGYGQRLPNIGNFTIILNNKIVNFDVMPRVQDGVPLTPFRYLFEHNGGSVKWDNSGKSVHADGDGKSIFFTIGNSVATVNDLTIKMEVAPFLERGRSIVPLSFIKDALNVDVQYDPNTGHVLITSTKK